MRPLKPNPRNPDSDLVSMIAKSPDLGKALTANLKCIWIGRRTKWHRIDHIIVPFNQRNVVALASESLYAETKILPFGFWFLDPGNGDQANP